MRNLAALILIWSIPIHGTKLLLRNLSHWHGCLTSHSGSHTPHQGAPCTDAVLMLLQLWHPTMGPWPSVETTLLGLTFKIELFIKKGEEEAGPFVPMPISLPPLDWNFSHQGHQWLQITKSTSQFSVFLLLDLLTEFDMIDDSLCLEALSSFGSQYPLCHRLLLLNVLCCSS